MLSIEQFKIIFITIVAITVIAVIGLIIHYKKKGINVEDNTFQLRIGLGGLAVVLSTFWLVGDITIVAKLKITGVGFAVGLLNFFAVDRAGRKLRKYLKIETEWDKERNRLEPEKNKMK